MTKLAANLKFLFKEFDFLERFRAAAQAGFQGVEYQSPYEYDKQVFKQKLTENGLSLMLINLPAGNRAGDRGIACHAGRTADFEEGVDRALDYATALGCKRVNCIAGMRPVELDPIEARETFIRNLQLAALRLKAAGIKLLIEPVNTRDRPGFFLNNSAQALDIIRAVGSDNLFLQCDIYHMQIMEGDLAPTIEKHLKYIAHMQIADTPGRHEPGTGEINFNFLLPYIDQIGFQGWMGCEYVPTAKTVDSLGRARRYLQDA